VKWWVPFARVSATVLQAIAVPIYKVSVGWWAEPYLARKEERKLTRDVKLCVSFLFTDEGGRIVPNVGVPFPPPFDYAFLTIALDHLLLRFVRGREEVAVHVAPTFTPTDWHDLSVVLSAMQRDSTPERRLFVDLWEVSRMLKPQLRALIDLFSVDHFSDFKRRLEDDFYVPEKNALRVLEAEINWRLRQHRGE
jgi:hypothetical protein